MKHIYESEVLHKLMERDGFNIPSSVPPYESEIKAYLINQVKQAYPKLTDYEAEWLLYNYTKHLPADFPINSVSNVSTATFENVVPFAYQSAILKGSTKYRDIDTGEILEAFEEGRNLELVSVKMPVLTTTCKNFYNPKTAYVGSDFNQDVYNKVNVKPNTTYTFYANGKSWLNCILYDKNDNQTRVLSGSPHITKSTFTTTENEVEVLLSYFTGKEGVIIEDVDFTGVQLEIGAETTSYEPYKTNILTVNEDVELRGIGDVKDTLDCLTGEVTERIGEIMLDGSEAWTYGGGNSTETIALFYTNLDGHVEYKPSINDKLPSIEGYSPNFGEGIYIDSDINIRIKRDKLNVSTVDGFKQWLSNNPIKIHYKLSQENIKTVDLTTVNENGESVYFMPLEGTMNVSCSSQTINPTFDMSVPVEATTQNLASFINLEMEE